MCLSSKINKTRWFDCTVAVCIRTFFIQFPILLVLIIGLLNINSRSYYYYGETVSYQNRTTTIGQGEILVTSLYADDYSLQFTGPLNVNISYGYNHIADAREWGRNTVSYATGGPYNSRIPLEQPGYVSAYFEDNTTEPVNASYPPFELSLLPASDEYGEPYDSLYRYYVDIYRPSYLVERERTQRMWTKGRSVLTIDAPDSFEMENVRLVIDVVDNIQLPDPISIHVYEGDLKNQTYALGENSTNCSEKNDTDGYVTYNETVYVQENEYYYPRSVESWEFHSAYMNGSIGTIAAVCHVSNFDTYLPNCTIAFNKPVASFSSTTQGGGSSFFTFIVTVDVLVILVLLCICPQYLFGCCCYPCFNKSRPNPQRPVQETPRQNPRSYVMMHSGPDGNNNPAFTQAAPSLSVGQPQFQPHPQPVVQYFPANARYAQLPPPIVIYHPSQQVSGNAMPMAMLPQPIVLPPQIYATQAQYTVPSAIQTLPQQTVYRQQPIQIVNQNPNSADSKYTLFA